MGLGFWDNEGTADFITQPVYSPNPYDVVVIAGRKTPGVAKVHAVPSRKVDRKKPAGSDGERPTFHGYVAAEVDVRIWIWTPDQLEVYDALVREVLWPAQSKQDPVALSIYHPELDRLRIKSVAIVSPSTLDDGRVPQERVAMIKCVEFAPPTGKNATKTILTTATRVKERQSSVAAPKKVIPGVNYSVANADQMQSRPPGKDPNYTGPNGA